MAWQSRKPKIVESDNELYYERQSERTIRRVIADMHDKPFIAVRQALKSAYPFGDRSGKAYRTWLKVYDAYTEALLSNHSQSRVG